MAKKGQTFKKYSTEFKDMREHGLSYKATMGKYFPHLYPKNVAFLKQWERIR